MPSLADLAIGGVLPGVLALVLLAIPWLLSKHSGARAARWVAPVAVGLAFIPASVVANNHASLWPVNASERALAVVGIGVLLGLVAAALGMHGLHGRSWARALQTITVGASGAFGACALAIALHPHAMSTAMLIGLITAAAVWTAVSTTLLARSERTTPGFGVPARLAIVLFGMSLVMLFSSIGVFAQATGGLVAAMASATLVGVWKREQSLGIGAYGVTLAAAAYFLIGAWQLSSNPPIGALVLISVAPAVAGIAAAIDRGGLVRRIASWLLVTVVTLAAVGWAIAVYNAAASSSPYGY